MMSSDNPEGIVGFYSYTFNIGKADIWYKSDKFTIKGINDCNFGIELSRAFQTDKYQLLVKKNNRKRELAKITVSILGEEITTILRNWKSDCVFISENGIIGPAIVEVKCEIIWYGTTEDAIPVQLSLTPFSEYHNFHSNSSLSDFHISIGGKELSAHKVILAAHSSVFLSMFETDMKEKRESRIIIKGIELDVMKIVLTILYTGYDGDLDELEKAENVLVVAERYDMKALKRLCEWKIFQKLDVSNVLDVLDKADKCNAGTLQTASMNLIVENKEQMAESEDWEMMCRNKPHLMGKLIQRLMITQ